jgi:hypothetical protein
MGVGASAASAATVTVTRDAQFDSFNEVRYVAGPGEENDLTADYAADALSVTITDPGAVITATGSCASRSPHSAVCTAPDPPFPIAGPYVQSVRALLGDGNDRAITTRTGPNVIGGIEAFGGPGDDVLTGSPTEDALDGGGGTDVLSGGAGGDTLTDGDRDGTTATLAPNTDQLDGGPGADTLSYRQRTHGVVVDLARDTPVGEPRERDVATGFESVTGGSGNDRLAGDGHDNVLDGGKGRNRLIGRGGDDILRSASGVEVQCGSGFDILTRPSGRTRIAPACERLSIRLPPRAGVDSGATIRPTPERDNGALRFKVSCPDIDGEPEDCRATMRVRAQFSHRLLAAGAIHGGSAPNRFLRLRLTALGRRLQGDHQRQWARIVIRGPLLHRTAWSIRF